jgi:hypothetical protein
MLVEPHLGLPPNPLLSLVLGLESAELDGWNARDDDLHIPAVVRLHLCRPELDFRIVLARLHSIGMARAGRPA